MLRWDRRLHVVAWILFFLTGFTSSLVIPGSINFTVHGAPTLECHGWPVLKCGLASEVAIPTSVIGPGIDTTVEGIAGSDMGLGVHRQAASRSFSWNPFMPMLPPPTAQGDAEEVAIAPPLVPITMSPKGNYGKNAASEAAYIGLLKSGIVNELKDGAIIFDLGCADGMNSLALLQEIKKKTQNFTITFVDLPQNDWDTTRAVLKTAIPTIYPNNGPVAARFQPEVSGGKGKETQVGFLLAKSFYERLAPESSVDVAFSSTSVQYMSDGGVSEKRAHAATDWLHFLRARAYELKPGGTLHVAASHTPFQGKNVGPVWNLVKRVLLEAADMGLITEAQKNTWCWPGYARTREEFTEPFTTGMVPKLTLEKFEVVLVESPYWAMANGDAAQFVEKYVPSIMAWIGPYLAKTLPRTVLDLLEVKLYSEVMIAPDMWRHDFNQALIKVRKKYGTDPGW